MDDILKNSGTALSTDDTNVATDGLPIDDIKNRTSQTDNASTNYFNRRFLDKNATNYELETFTKNKMLIFNQKNFPGESPREGTEMDVAALVSCFEQLNFEINCFHDCTRDELLDNLEKAINQDLSDYGCFAVVILTNGYEDGLLKTRNFPIHEDQIVQALKGSNAPSLSTKPKMLIIQADRGDATSHAVQVEQMPYDCRYQHQVHSSKNYAYNAADESDFLIIHSSSPGMVSHRNQVYGTCLIQSLCKSINESKPHEDILDVLTRVQRYVSINYEFSQPGATEDRIGKQLPMTTTTPMRKLYLKSGVNFAKTKKQKRWDHSAKTFRFTTPTKNAEKLEEFKQSEEVEKNTNDETSSLKEKRRNVDKKRLEASSAHDTDVSTKYFNSRLLDEDITTYELEKFTKNKMLIFSQENCRGETSREGTNKDVEALKACFKKRAFEVECFKDCKRHELFQNLKEAIKQDLSDYGCFAVVILTHRSYDEQLMTANCPFYEREILELLESSNAPGLLTKPKILIIQACRGEDTHGWRTRNYAFSIPEESDFLTIYSTPPDKRAYRDEQDSFGFIQTLCKCINKSKPNDDLLDGLMSIRHDANINVKCNYFEFMKKGIVQINSTLTKKLYLNKCMNQTDPVTNLSTNARKLLHGEQSEEAETNSSIEKPVKMDFDSIATTETSKMRSSEVKFPSSDNILKDEYMDKNKEAVCTTPEETSTDDINAAKAQLSPDDIKNQTFQTDEPSTKCYNRYLDKNATTYELENFTKNKMLIFIQDNCPGETPREGTDKDVAALEACFKKRAFEVECFHDCTKVQLFNNLQKAINKDLSDYGCFCVVILTHGSYDGLLKTIDNSFYLHQIVDALNGTNAPSLFTKPKILIIQTCQDDRKSHIVPVSLIPCSTSDSPGSRNDAYTLADGSDFLIIHGTFPGKKAHRSKENGTWFIQSLCQFINESEPSEDMLDVLTCMRRDVLIGDENSRFEAEEKHLPEVTTTLTRILYLNSKVEAQTNVETSNSEDKEME